MKRQSIALQPNGTILDFVGTVKWNIENVLRNKRIRQARLIMNIFRSRLGNVSWPLRWGLISVGSILLGTFIGSLFTK